MQSLRLCALALWLLAPPVSAQNSAAALHHRPQDGIRAFAEGCITATPSQQRADDAFGKYNLALRISSRPQGDFPAGNYNAFNASGTARTGKVSECRVRIRGLWLSSADPAIANALKKAGFTQIKSLPAKTRRNRSSIQNGRAAGLYRARGKTFLVQVAQVRQKAGRTTELAIVQLAPQ